MIRSNDFEGRVTGGTLNTNQMNGVYEADGNIYVSFNLTRITYGCTDPEATNYDPDATVDDGSCIYGPVIISIADVPEDQGGWVILNWTANSLDIIPNNIITEYSIYRWWPAMRGWELLGNIAAAYHESYSQIVETNEISIPDSGIYHWTTYFVRANTSDPFVYYDSPPESGYSIDNIPPEYDCDLGDVNCDGELNVIDVVNLINIVLTAGDYIEEGDVSGDGYLNILDVVQLINLVLYGDDGACMDIDGNVYETVQIDEQLWMAENLKVTHYNDGSEIPTGYSDLQWTELLNGAFEIYNNDNENIEIYGNLYNWYAVDDERGICPEGFHIPTIDQWIILTDYLSPEGMESWGNTYAGGIMKECTIGSCPESEYWNSPNAGATNESGFTGLPSGTRWGLNDGRYSAIGEMGWYWSSTTNTESLAWSLKTEYNDDNTYPSPYKKSYGFSVRCLAD